MLSFRPMFVAVALCAMIMCFSNIVQGVITEDPNLVVKWPRGVGQHAIQVVGDSSKIIISATNYKTVQNEQSGKFGISSTGKCKKLVNEEIGTFNAPCTFSTNKHAQTFHVECVESNGSASIFFPKQGGKRKEAVIDTAGTIWAGFSNKKNEPLKQGNLKNDGDRVAVIFSCDNDSRGSF